MNILQIAEEEGFEVLPTGNGGFIIEDISTGDAIFRFAARIRAEQKEKDAKICDKVEREYTYCADAIRNSKDEPAATVADRIDEGRI